MSRLPTGIVGKVLALGICVLLLATLDVILISPIIGLYDRGRDRLQERMDTIDRLTRSAQDLPRLRIGYQKIHDEAQSDQLVFTGSNDTITLATLQSTMKALVQRGGAKLDSAELLPPEDADAFRRVGVRITFTGDLAVLTAVLRGVEEARPKLFVNGLEVRGATIPAGGETKPLSISMDIYGLRVT